MRAASRSLPFITRSLRKSHYAGGQPVPGFTLADCEEIGGNFIDHRVSWKGKTDVSPLAGRPVRLYIKLTRAKFFAFQFQGE